MAVVLTLWLGDSGSRRGASQGSQPETAASEARAEEMRAESLELEARFDESVPEGTLATADQLLLLEHALEAQRDYVRMSAGPAWEAQERVRELEVKLATARGRGLFARSEVLEAEAAAVLARGERAEAVVALQEALRLQREIHASVAEAVVRRPAREAALLLQIESLEAEPLAALVDRLQDEARAAQIAGDVTRAEVALREAAQAQERINREHSRTRFAGRARLEQIEGALASLGAIELVRARNLAAAQALDFDQNGRGGEAAVLFGRARELQERINSQYPRSEAASPTRPADFEVARQTAASRARVAECEQVSGGLDAALAAARFDEARSLIRRARGLDAAVREEFPRSRLIDAARTGRFTFLETMAAQLESVHGAVDGRLVAVPGSTVRMFATEVPQRLYTTLVGTNPSRTTGESLPAESLTAAEAEEFCRRLGLLLGRRVRLPRQSEFAAAMAGQGGDVWSAERSGGVPRAVDAGVPDSGGFRDLRGNLAEWITGDAAGEVLVAGGSCADAVDAIAASPFRVSARTERYRTVGFRFVVE